MKTATCKKYSARRIKASCAAKRTRMRHRRAPKRTRKPKRQRKRERKLPRLGLKRAPRNRPPWLRCLLRPLNPWWP